MSNSETDDLLAERGTTHGDYSENARISQALTRVLESSPVWKTLPDVVRNTLVMECQKNGRILAGDPTFDDHWRDKIGYCQLVLDWIEDRPRPARK